MTFDASARSLQRCSIGALLRAGARCVPRLGVRLVGALPALGFAAGAALCQVAQSDPSSGSVPQPFAETVDVSIVELDVFVSNAEGEPARGLLRDDFVVTTPSGVAPIVAFAERDQLALLDAQATIEPEPRTLIVYLDEIGLHPAARARVLDGVRTAADSMPPGSTTRIGLVRSGVGLEVLIAPTSPESFIEALESVPPPSARALRGHSDRREAIEELERRSGASRRGEGSTRCNDRREMELRAIVARYAASAESRNESSLASLDGLLTVVGSLGGRKDVVFVSTALEFIPGNGIYARAEEMCPDLGLSSIISPSRSLANELTDLAARANAYRTTLHVVDPRQPSDIGVRIDSDSTGSVGAGVRQAMVSGLRDAIGVLSAETGGRSIFNTGDVSWGFQQVNTDASHYYSVGLSSTFLDVKKAQRVEVRLKRPRDGYKIRYRRALVRPLEDDRRAMRLFAALWLGETTNLLAATAEPRQPLKKDQGLSVVISLPVRELFLDASVEEVTIQLAAMARDQESGARTAPRQETRTVRRAEVGAASLDGAVEFSLDIPLPDGSWDIAVGVEELTTMRYSVLKLGGVRTPL